MRYVYTQEKNRSGSTSIIIVDKSHGKFREVKTIGSSSYPSAIENLYRQGNLLLAQYASNQDVFAEHAGE